MKKLSVVSDIGKNRLYFTIAGKVTKKELNSFYTDVRFSAAEFIDFEDSRKEELWECLVYESQCEISNNQQ